MAKKTRVRTQRCVAFEGAICITRVIIEHRESMTKPKCSTPQHVLCFIHRLSFFSLFLSSSRSLYALCRTQITTKLYVRACQSVHELIALSCTAECKKKKKKNCHIQVVSQINKTFVIFIFILIKSAKSSGIITNGYLETRKTVKKSGEYKISENQNKEKFVRNEWMTNKKRGSFGKKIYMARRLRPMVHHHSSKKENAT